ncbi:MAG: hypothetical protein R3B06_10060 [Kofleriaceae bacterium]
MIARGLTWRQRAIRLVVGAALVALWWPLADARRAAIRAVVNNDAAPGAGPRLATGPGVGLPPTPLTRVVLIDGAGRPTAAGMANWSALCARGLDLTVDVGFPTVSLPVELALWSGRTQQQTGVLFHSNGKPVPVPRDGIPAQVPRSLAVAEASAYIVHSLGFAETEPPTPAKTLPDGWAERWVEVARAAVASDRPLVFVHILRVDAAGHKAGKPSLAWTEAAASADAILGALVAAAPTARWIVVADHDHITGGGHGGEARAIRIVRGCLAGPDVEVGHGGPIHVVDLARAIADSVGAHLAPDAAGRPLAAALAAPVTDAEVLPSLPVARVALAVLVLALGLGATAWGMRGRWWTGPWWWPVALVALLTLATTPSLSTPMIYKPQGQAMRDAFAPGLVVLVAWLAVAVHRDWRRGLVAQLALPWAATAAVWLVTGAAWLAVDPTVCPVVPRWTAWLPPLTLMAASGAAAAGLVVLASAVLPGTGPSTPAGTSRSDHAAR